MSAPLPAILLLALVGAAPGASSSPVVLVPVLPPQAEPSALHEAAARRAYEATRAHFKKGELDQALRAADEAFAHVPNANTALVRARVLAGLGRCREAFEGLLLTLDLKPTADDFIHHRFFFIVLSELNFDATNSINPALCAHKFLSKH